VRCGHTTKVGPEMFIDLEPGLWIWRIPHPHPEPDGDGDRVVTSVCVEQGGKIAAFEPWPPEDDEVWDRLDARAPTMAVVLKPARWCSRPVRRARAE